MIVQIVYANNDPDPACRYDDPELYCRAASLDFLPRIDEEMVINKVPHRVIDVQHEVCDVEDDTMLVALKGPKVYCIKIMGEI